MGDESVVGSEELATSWTWVGSEAVAEESCLGELEARVDDRVRLEGAVAENAEPTSGVERDREKREDCRPDPPANWLVGRDGGAVERSGEVLGEVEPSL